MKTQITNSALRNPGSHSGIVTATMARMMRLRSRFARRCSWRRSTAGSGVVAFGASIVGDDAEMTPRRTSVSWSRPRTLSHRGAFALDPGSITDLLPALYHVLRVEADRAAIIFVADQLPEGDDR